MGWLDKLGAAWRWWSAECARHDCRHDAQKAERVLMAMEQRQARRPTLLTFSVEAVAHLVGAAPGDLPPILGRLERDGMVFRDPMSGRYTLIPIPSTWAPDRGVALTRGPRDRVELARPRRELGLPAAGGR